MDEFIVVAIMQHAIIPEFVKTVVFQTHSILTILI